MRVLVVDNYDSFTYNIVDLLRSLRVPEIKVVYNDRLKWNQVDQFHKILISPGPGTPDEAGMLMPFIEKYHKTKSILGICLGHQAIAQAFGGQLINLNKPRHGKTLVMNILTTDPLFSGFPEEIAGGLYHSWSVDPSTLPPGLEVIAFSDEDVMGIRHRNYDLTGLQFHPESYATPLGAAIISNWLYGSV